MTSSPLSYKPLLIVGYPRSGTTWTMWLLAQHPDVVSSFHGGFFHALAHLVKWQQTPGGFGKFIVPPLTAENKQSAQSGDRKVDWMEALPDNLLQNELRTMAQDFFEVIASQANNPSVVLENTPENMTFLDWILDLVPEAHILHVIRDPRSTWLSIRRASKSWLKPSATGAFPTTLEKNTMGWQSYIELGHRIQARTPNYREIQYETLKANGPAELNRIYEWLGLTTDLDFCGQALKNTALENMTSLMPSPPGFFGKGKTDDWRQALSKSEIKQIEYLAGDTMEALGYTRLMPRVSKKPWQLGLSTFMSRTATALRRRLARW